MPSGQSGEPAGQFPGADHLARTCAAVAAVSLVVGAVRPAPLVLALVLLLSIPWTLAVTRRLANEENPQIP